MCRTASSAPARGPRPVTRDAPSRAFADVDGRRALRESQRRRQRAGLRVDLVGRQVGDAVRRERPPQVDRLVACADELEFGLPRAHVRSNEWRGDAFPRRSGRGLCAKSRACAAVESTLLRRGSRQRRARRSRGTRSPLERARSRRAGRFARARAGSRLQASRRVRPPVPGSRTGRTRRRQGRSPARSAASRARPRA